MKKSFIAIALILVLAAVCFAACGGESGAPANTQAPADVTEAPADVTEAPADVTDAPAGTEQTADFMGKPFSNDFDMAVMIGGKAYPVRVDSAEVLSVLGDDCEKDEQISCVYDGMDKTFTYDGIIVSTVPVDGKDVIEMFTITSADYSTTRNITVGASRDDVIAAYGENYWDDGYVTYTESGDENNISEMRIQFLFEGDTVSEIYIYSPSYAN